MRWIVNFVNNLIDQQKKLKAEEQKQKKLQESKQIMVSLTILFLEIFDSFPAQFNIKKNLSRMSIGIKYNTDDTYTLSIPKEDSLLKLRHFELINLVKELYDRLDRARTEACTMCDEYTREYNLDYIDLCAANDQEGIKKLQQKACRDRVHYYNALKMRFWEFTFKDIQDNGSNYIDIIFQVFIPSQWR